MSFRVEQLDDEVHEEVRTVRHRPTDALQSADGGYRTVEDPPKIAYRLRLHFRQRSERRQVRSNQQFFVLEVVRQDAPCALEVVFVAGRLQISWSALPFTLVFK